MMDDQSLEVPINEHTSPDEEDNVIKHPDGGWGWIVCFTSFLCNGTIFGIIVCNGIVFVAIADEFGNGESNISTKTALVGSLCIGLTMCVCSVASIVSDKIGIRPTGVIGGIVSSIGIISSAFVQDISMLWLTYGVLLGVGLAFVYNPAMVILGHYFKRHYGLVNGIFTTGGNVTGIALSLLLRPLLNAVGFRYTMISMSVLTLLTILCALTWKPLMGNKRREGAPSVKKESEVGSDEDRCGCVRSCFNVSIWRNKYYVILLFGASSFIVAYSSIVVHLVNHTREVFPDHDPNLVVLYMIISGGLSQLIVGKMADFRWVNRVHILQAAFLWYSACVICIPWITNYALLVAVVFAIGIGQGPSICLTSPIVIDVVGYENSSQALGFVLTAFSLPATISPPLIGLMRDKFGNYDLAFCIIGCFPPLGALIMCLIPRSAMY